MLVLFILTLKVLTKTPLPAPNPTHNYTNITTKSRIEFKRLMDTDYCTQV